MIIILGSTALNYHNILENLPRDLDILGNYDEVVSFMNSQDTKPIQIYPFNSGKKLVAKFKNQIIEAEINWDHGSSKMLFDLALNESEPIKLPYTNFLIPSLDLLYTLKMSHRYLRNSPHFLKTMNHIHLMRKHGSKIKDEYKEFFKVREEETYWYKHPKLNVKKDNFFKDDGIQYIFDHDDIHKSIKHLEKPAYQYYSTDEVMCSKKKFEECSEEIKLYGVLEEAYVLALERSQIPFKDSPTCPTPKKSFEIALQKVSSSITSGYFREYAWENYHKVLELYNEKYLEIFWNKVNLGEVKLFNKEIYYG